MRSGVWSRSRLSSARSSHTISCTSAGAGAIDPSAVQMKTKPMRAFPLSLLMATEGHEGEDVITVLQMLGGLYIRSDCGNPQPGFLEDLSLQRVIDVLRLVDAAGRYLERARINRILVRLLPHLNQNLRATLVLPFDNRR